MIKGRSNNSECWMDVNSELQLWDTLCRSQLENSWFSPQLSAASGRFSSPLFPIVLPSLSTRLNSSLLLIFLPPFPHPSSLNYIILNHPLLSSSPPLICCLGSGPVKLPVVQSHGDRVQNLITHWQTARTTCHIFAFSPFAVLQQSLNSSFLSYLLFFLFASLPLINTQIRHVLHFVSLCLLLLPGGMCGGLDACRWDAELSV